LKYLGASVWSRSITRAYRCFYLVKADRVEFLQGQTTCYVSIDYLLDQNPEPLADYLVHEVAHVFHNCKRGAIGLERTRRREWLLDIDYRMRETFAY